MHVKFAWSGGFLIFLFTVSNVGKNSFEKKNDILDAIHIFILLPFEENVTKLFHE